MFLSCDSVNNKVTCTRYLPPIEAINLPFAGGRCTDGCWLSVRKHKLKDGQPCLLLLLDFEGIGSWERTEQEDMLLSLLSAAISNWTLFKTHFTFDRYTQQTLQRFNLGAPKVRAMCGGADARVFAGDIVFCLKDVVGFAVEEVKEEVSLVQKRVS